MFKNLKSWKTSAVGFLSGLVIVATQIIALLDTDPATVFSYEALVAALAVMGIGFFARDNDKSSEEVGTKG